MCHNGEAAVGFVVRHHMSYKDDGSVDENVDNTGVNSICLICMDPVDTFVLKCSSKGGLGTWHTPFADPKLLEKIQQNNGADTLESGGG